MMMLIASFSSPVITILLLSVAKAGRFHVVAELEGRLSVEEPVMKAILPVIVLKAVIVVVELIVPVAVLVEEMVAVPVKKEKRKVLFKMLFLYPFVPFTFHITAISTITFRGRPRPRFLGTPESSTRCFVLKELETCPKCVDDSVALGP